MSCWKCASLNPSPKAANYTFTPKMYPTKADKPIAMVPQMTIRTMAFRLLEPPVFAENPPRKTRDSMVNA
jgi:hypothetical protein